MEELVLVLLHMVIELCFYFNPSTINNISQARQFLVLEGCPVQCRTDSSTPGLYLLKATSNHHHYHPQLWQLKRSPATATCLLEGKTALKTYRFIFWRICKWRDRFGFFILKYSKLQGGEMLLESQNFGNCWVMSTWVSFYSRLQCTFEYSW